MHVASAASKRQPVCTFETRSSPNQKPSVFACCVSPMSCVEQLQSVWVAPASKSLALQSDEQFVLWQLVVAVSDLEPPASELHSLLCFAC